MDAAELTSAQVADQLGVKVQTVYAYVSRGVLRPVRRDARAGSLFAWADVQALLDGGRSGRRRRPGASDDVRTTITEISAGRLAYRGRDVEELVGQTTFEQVRALLVGGEDQDEHDPGTPTPAERQALGAVLSALPEGSAALDRFKHAVLVAGSTDPGRHDRSPAAIARAGRRAAWFMAMALPGAEPASIPLASEHSHLQQAPDQPLSMAATLAAVLDPCPAALLEAALVLLADHDLAVSATAVRVATSSGADPYSALLAGLAAADSPLHMAASLPAVDWLAGAIQDPQQVLDAALALGAPPGFGHVVYTEQDPRAQVLLELLSDHGCPPDQLAALRLVEQELALRRGWVLNIDLALALLVHTYGLPRDSGAVIFACARTAGWTAHAIEELAEPGMRFRLRGVYGGSR